MREHTAYLEFKKARWPKTNGVPDHCVQCGSVNAKFYETNRRRFRCSDCRGDFSVTSKTIFASHKLSFRDMLAALSLAANAVKNEAALLLTRQLGVQWKTAFVLMTKLRKAIASERVAPTLDGTVEIDGCYIGGHRRKENRKVDRKDARLVENQTGKRRCILVLRQRSGRTVTAVTLTESREAAVALAKKHVARGARMLTDAHAAYGDWVPSGSIRLSTTISTTPTRTATTRTRSRASTSASSGRRRAPTTGWLESIWIGTRRSWPTARIFGVRTTAGCCGTCWAARWPIRSHDG